MSDNSKRPLTRREIREREQRAAAAAAQGGAPGGPSIAGPSGGQHPPRGSYGAPPIAPVAPPPRPSSAPSRRALREPEQGYPAQGPVVRPPTTTGGVRGIDATGRLTPVQRASGDTAARPVTPSSATPPSRTSMRQPFGGSAHDAPGARDFPGRGGSGPAAPQAAPPSAPPSPWAASAPTPASVPPSRSDQTGRFGTGYTPPDDAPTRAAAPPLPWGATQAEPATRPASSSPFDALVGADQPVRARSAAPQVEADDEDEWEEPESSYTWLHYIVLIVVAFVLGLLVWKLLLDGPGGGFETEQAAAMVGAIAPTGPGDMS